MNKEDEITLGNELKNLKEFSKGLDPESIGYSIGQSDFIRETHNSFTRPEPIVYQSVKATKKDDVYHFVSFLKIGNGLYEIDGLKNGPIMHR